MSQAEDPKIYVKEEQVLEFAKIIETWNVRPELELSLSLFEFIKPKLDEEQFSKGSPLFCKSFDDVSKNIEEAFLYFDEVISKDQNREKNNSSSKLEISSTFLETGCSENKNFDICPFYMALYDLNNVLRLEDGVLDKLNKTLKVLKLPKIPVVSGSLGLNVLGCDLIIEALQELENSTEQKYGDDGQIFSVGEN